ncbi:MAG: hypothetical protein V4537_18010 [Pseudomonadota bacterium]
MTDLHRPDPFRRTGSEERGYLLKRADDHRQLAEKSSEAGARALHLRFERLYLEEAACTVVVDRD